MTNARVKVLIVIFLLSILFQVRPVSVRAALSCAATVSPSEVEANTIETPFTFTVTNNGSNPVTYIKVVVPSSNFQLYNYGVSGWSVGANTSQAELTGGSLAPSATLEFSFRITVGSTEAASADWTISTYDDVELVDCTGTLGTAIVGAADVTPPVLSDPSVSSVTSTTAVISWTSNEVSNTVVNYGTGTSSLTSTATGNSSTTEHSVSISDLTANTTYYYEYCSTDSSGNAACFSGYNFTTGAAGLVIVGTPTPTPKSTSTPGPSPTPTPIPADSVKPRVNITTDLESNYEVAPVIEGTASDNEVVTAVDYSTDGGENWLPVDNSEGLGTGSVTFDFIPYVFEDGNYDIVVRAIDGNENIGLSETKTLVLDRLPPRIGGNLLSIGPQVLLPNEDGVIITMSGIDMNITLSAVGGPISIDLYVSDKKFILNHSDETGLWSGTINVDKPGLYTIKTKAIDGAGNINERDLNSILVVAPGKITGEDGKAVKSGEVTLYVQDTQSEIWSVWDGETFGQPNPYEINEFGEYQYFLPPGTYYLQIKSPGHPVTTSQIFKLNNSTAFNSDFALKKSGGIRLGPVTLRLFNYLTERTSVVLKTPKVNQEQTNSLVGKDMPSFSLRTAMDEPFNQSDLRGKESVLTFVSTWSPPSVEQVSILDDLVNEELLNSTIVAVEETASKVSIFQRRGNYKVDIVVDPDGEIVEDFNINSLPLHYFLNRSGEIKKVAVGVLNKDEINAIFDEIR
jgi:peroxiredoxin